MIAEPRCAAASRRHARMEWARTPACDGRTEESSASVRGSPSSISLAPAVAVARSTHPGFHGPPRATRNETAHHDQAVPGPLPIILSNQHRAGCFPTTAVPSL